MRPLCSWRYLTRKVGSAFIFSRRFFPEDVADAFFFSGFSRYHFLANRLITYRLGHMSCSPLVSVGRFLYQISSAKCSLNRCSSILKIPDITLFTSVSVCTLPVLRYFLSKTIRVS